MNYLRKLVLTGMSCLFVACGGGGSSGKSGAGEDSRNLQPTITMISEMDVLEKSLVNVSAESVDPDGSIESFLWEQIAGPHVHISVAVSNALSFEALDFDLGNVLVFRLTVTDDDGISISKEVKINIRPKFRAIGFLQDYGYTNGVLEASADYFQFEARDDGSHRIVLRSEEGDADLEMYSSAAMESSLLLGSSANGDGENDALILDLRGGSTYYVKVDATEETYYSLSVNMVEPYLEPG